ncbi:MAG: hypothetical protein J7L21_07505 [Sulfurimonas sp.]|nr:hypothetical protein [Sulfurimonas sp.]
MNKDISHKTPQERLEIREFILDANLFLISKSLTIAIMMGTFLYYMLYQFFSNEILPKMLNIAFIGSSIFYIIMIIFVGMGFMEIRNQKRYINRLNTIFSDDDKKNHLNKDETSSTSTLSRDSYDVSS